jgi:hypothetical protein
MADDTGVGQLPTQLSPQVLANLSGGGSPLGPTSPIDPQQVAAQMMQRGGQLTEQQLGIANPAAQKATDLASAPYKTNDPVYGTWSGRAPGSAPPQQQPGFLHTIGRALIALGEATAPGRTILNQRYASQTTARGSEANNRAEEIQALQKQSQLAEEPIASTARMGPAYMGAAARQESADASASRAETAAGNLKERISNDVVSQNVKWKTLDVKQQALELKNTLSRLGMQVTMRGQDINFGTREDAIAAVSAVQGTKIWNELDDSLKSKLMQYTGISDFAVPSAQSPGTVIPKEGASPTDVGRSKLPPKPGEKPAKPKGGANEIHYDKNGNRVQGPA